MAIRDIGITLERVDEAKRQSRSSISHFRGCYEWPHADKQNERARKKNTAFNRNEKLATTVHLEYILLVIHLRDPSSIMAFHLMPQSASKEVNIDAVNLFPLNAHPGTY